MGDFNLESILPFVFILLAGGTVAFFNKEKLKSKIKEALHKYKNKETENELKSLNEKKVQVRANIAKLESEDKNKQILIRHKLDTTAKEIQTILDEKNPEKIQNELNENWNDL